MGCIKLRYDDGMKFTFGGREKGYRFGFNGMHNVDESKGIGNCLVFGAKIYDSKFTRMVKFE